MAFRATTNYLNPYERSYFDLSRNQELLSRISLDDFNAMWRDAANKGELYEYTNIVIPSLLNKPVHEVQKELSDINYQYLDDRNKRLAIQTLDANKTNVEQTRQRYKVNDFGDVMLDKDNNPIMEEYQASDYEYFKSLLAAKGEQGYQKYLRQQEQEQKDALNVWQKIWYDTVGIGTGLVYGLANQLDNLTNSLAAIGNAVVARDRKGIADAIVETNASDTWRFFENAGLQDWIVDFERRFTDWRDINGEYTGIGTYIGGISTTLGQMVPSMAISFIGGKIGGAAGMSTEAVSKMSDIISSLVFYQGITAGNVRDIYREMAKYEVSPGNAAILANAVIKSALQYAVEIGLSKILGGTDIDNVVFGRTRRKSISSTLTLAGAKRLLADFVQEGLEEVFQDTSDFLVDRAFSTLIDENFGDITDISWQSLIDSFVIGGLTSFAGSAFGINGVAWTKKVDSANIKFDKNGNIQTDKQGNVKFEKLNKLASWEYGLNMQSFASNFAQINERIELAEADIANGKYEGHNVEGLAAAFTEMYAAYRMITSIYKNIGEERFKAANNVLTQITDMINAGKFDTERTRQALDTFVQNLNMFRVESLGKSAEKVKEKLKEAGMTESVIQVDRDTDVDSLDIDDGMKEKIKSLLSTDPNLKHLVITADGNNIVPVDLDIEGLRALFVPIKYANNASAETIYENVAEQRLVETIASKQYKGAPIDFIIKLYRDITNDQNKTVEEALYNVIFNKSFFFITLSTANKDTYAFLSSLIDMSKAVNGNTIRDKIYKDKIDTAIKNMKEVLVDYLKNQPYVNEYPDYLSDAQVKSIKAARWCRDLYRRVIDNDNFKRLTSTDWDVLRKRVNSMPVKQDVKDKILADLQSNDKNVRTSAMNRISMVYKGIFQSLYDGKTYMPDTSIPNRTFNSFLQDNGFTLQTLLDVNLVSDEEKTAIIAKYNDFNVSTLKQYRQFQFENYAYNARYTFDRDNGHFVMYELGTGVQVGFDTYNENIANLTKDVDLNKRTNIERARKRNGDVLAILNSNVDSVVAATLSIDDVINDPSLLSNEIQAKIKDRNGKITSESAFLYLRKYFLDTFKDRTVIVTQDGTYAFGNVRPMSSLLVKDDIVLSDVTNIKDVINSKYLYGRLVDTKIVINNTPDFSAFYSATENVIYVNDEFAKGNKNALKFAILHEFQHAMATENRQNLGIGDNWLASKLIDAKTRKNIVEDIKRHRPELFLDVDNDVERETKIANDFIYYSSGESTAYGIDASDNVDFYPTIVNYNSQGTFVKLPWGSTYKIGNAVFMAFKFTESYFNTFDFNINEYETYAKYLLTEGVASDALKAKIKHIHNNITLDSFYDKYNAYIQTYVDILRATDLIGRNVANGDSFAHTILPVSTAYDFYALLNRIENGYIQAITETTNWTIDDSIKNVTHMYLPHSIAISMLDAKYNKVLSVNDIIQEYYDNEPVNLPVEQRKLVNDIFNRFKDISRTFVPNIKSVGFTYKKNDSGFFGDKVPLNARGFYFNGRIRYFIGIMNNDTIPHEIFHYISYPSIQHYMNGDFKYFNSRQLYLLNILKSLYDVISKQDSAKPYAPVFKDLHEFVCYSTSQIFRTLLSTNIYLPQSLKSTLESLVGKTYADNSLLYASFLRKLVDDVFVLNIDNVNMYRNSYKTTPLVSETIDYADSHNYRFAFYFDNEGKKHYYDDYDEMTFDTQLDLTNPNIQSIRFEDLFSKSEQVSKTSTEAEYEREIRERVQEEIQNGRSEAQMLRDLIPLYIKKSAILKRDIYNTPFNRSQLERIIKDEIKNGKYSDLYNLNRYSTVEYTKPDENTNELELKSLTDLKKEYDERVKKGEFSPTIDSDKVVKELLSTTSENAYNNYIKKHTKEIRDEATKLLSANSSITIMELVNRLYKKFGPIVDKKDLLKIINNMYKSTDKGREFISEQQRLVNILKFAKGEIDKEVSLSKTQMALRLKYEFKNASDDLINLVAFIVTQDGTKSKILTETERKNIFVEISQQLKDTFKNDPDADAFKVINDIVKKYPDLTLEDVFDVIKRTYSIKSMYGPFVQALNKDETKKQISQLNDAAKAFINEDTKKTMQGRIYQEPVEGQERISYTTKSGEKGYKVPRRDANGEYLRDKNGHIKYYYHTPGQYDRYVSKGIGGNMEKYGYISKNKSNQYDPRFVEFVQNANENIDKKLWDKLVDGKLTLEYIREYFLTADKIDDETFKLINDSLYKNKDIRTFAELENYITKTEDFYALRRILRQLHQEHLLAQNESPQLIARLEKLIASNSEYNERFLRYKEEFNNNSYSDKSFRIPWMEHFDGSIEMAGYIASNMNIAKMLNWNISGEADISKSIDQEVADDMTVGDVLSNPDTSDVIYQLTSSISDEEMISDILSWFTKLNADKLKALGAEKAYKIVERKREKLNEMTTNELSQLRKQYRKMFIARTANINPKTLTTQQAENLNKVANKIEKNINDRPADAIIKTIKGKLNTIKRNLTSKQQELFYEENSDIVNKDLTIRDELIHYNETTKNGFTRVRLQPVDKLKSLEERVNNLRNDQSDNFYASKESLDTGKKLKRKMSSLQAELDKQYEKSLRDKGARRVVRVIDSEKVVVNSNMEMPASVEKLLNTNFKEIRKTNIQYVVEGDEYHIKTSLSEFMDANKEYLQNLTQGEADEIIDFFSSGNVNAQETNKARQYSAIQIYMLAYLLKEAKAGHFSFTETQIQNADARLKTIVGTAYTEAKAWTSVITWFKPEQIIIQAFARELKIEMSEEDARSLVDAVNSGDLNRLKNVKEALYKKYTAKFVGNKRTFLERLYKFERMAMLSGPGTWLRNITSNIVVTGGNIAGANVGKTVTNILEKVFPKKFKRDVKNQYVLTGTKVTTDVKNFIQKNFIDNGFLNLVQDGITKYDPASAKVQGMTGSNAMETLLSNAIISKIFQDNTFNNKLVNDVHKIVMKMLSDDRVIIKTALKYFGKMLVEDNVDITKGLSKDVINHFADAYRLAAYDYMHRGNFFNKMETLLRERVGDTAFFMYKQVFPFASATWNWFVEGLNYTPVGLAKAIVQFAKLENTIAKMNDKGQISDRFAKYLVTRNIGKGVIGSIGTLLGMLLVGSGVARIDTDDDDYKLIISLADQQLVLDITDVFGTQGIFIGMTMVSAFKDMNTLFGTLGTTLDAMFMDSTFASLFNSFRYSDTFGEWVMNQPFTFLNSYIPNFVKTFSTIANKYKVKYSSGFKGKIERFIVNAIPGLAYAFPKQMDIYTGEKQIAYKMWFVTQLANKLLPFKVYPYNVSDIEKEAISLGITKGPLSGKYDDVTLDTKQIEMLNEYYGKLNNNSLKELFSNRKTYVVLDKKTNKYVELKYSKMTNEQKKTVINRLMTDNSNIAKIYILTSQYGYKYYASDSEYSELKKLGIRNVYKKTEKKTGLVA